MIYNVLIVDNDERLLDRICEELLPLGQNLHIANSRSSAWDQFVKKDIEFVIMNLYLEAKLSLDLIKEFKLIRPNIGIISMTNVGTYELATQCIDLNVLGIIDKPIDFQSFQGHVSKYFNKFHTAQYYLKPNSEIIQCPVCTKVKFPSSNGKTPSSWEPLDIFFNKKYNTLLHLNFCTSCSQLTIDQAEKFIIAGIRKFKENPPD